MSSKKDTMPKQAAQQVIDIVEFLFNKFYAPSNPFKEFGSFGRPDFRLLRNDMGSPIILRVDKENQCTQVDPMNVVAWLREFIVSDPYILWEFQSVSTNRLLESVRDWMERMPKEKMIQEMPVPFAFHKDIKDLCINRLDYDPDMSAECPPILKSMLDRIEFGHGDLLAARIGSIFDFKANRKQTIWCYGAKDCGKSAVAKMLSTLLCNRSISFVSNSLLSNAHFSANWVGKRVVVVSEAGASFIRSDSFKTFTGDDIHTVNPKNRPMFVTRLPLLFFFFSNEPPAIPAKDELIERIISCKMSALTEDDMIEEGELEETINSCRSEIVGYCIQKWEALKKKNGRLAVNRDAIEEGMEQFSSVKLDFISKYLHKSPNKFVLSTDLHDLYKEKMTGSTSDFGHFKDLLKREMGVNIERKNVILNFDHKRRMSVVEGVEFTDQAGVKNKDIKFADEAPVYKLF